jgi:hypothetical protein
VIRYLEDDQVNVLYSDGILNLNLGAFASRNKEFEWTKVSADGVKTVGTNNKQPEVLRYAKETDVATKTVNVTRADFVNVTKTIDGKVKTSHSDGTTITRDPNLKSTTITSGDTIPKISFSLDPKVGNVVEMGKAMKLSRKRVDGADVVEITRV